MANNRDDQRPLTPASYPLLTAQALWDNLPLVLLGSALFSLAWLPAALLLFMDLPVLATGLALCTIGPAWAALLYYEAELLQDRKVSGRTMLTGLRRHGQRGLALGALASLPLYVLFANLSLLDAAGAPPGVLPALFASACVLALMATLAIYAFPLMVLHDQGIGPALRNAAILSARFLASTVALLALASLFALAVGFISSGLIFILPAIWGLFTVNNTRMAVQNDTSTRR
jgi:uncharacterized membrane protein YesL